MAAGALLLLTPKGGRSRQMNEVPGVDDGALLRYGLVRAVAAQRDADANVSLEASSPAHEGEREP